MATAHTLVSPYPPHPQSSPSNVQSMTGDFRLPSIKDLNFPTQLPSQDATPAPNTSDHGSLQSAHSARHQHPAWSRNQQPSSNGSSQHNPSMPPPPGPVKASHKAALKSDGGYAPPGMHYQPDGAQAPNTAVSSHMRPANVSQATSKRGRSSSTVSASTGRSPHSNNIPHPHQPQHSSPTYPPGPTPQSQGSPEQAHQPPSPYPPAGAAYPYPSPQQMAQRGYPVQPSQAPPSAQHQQHQHQAPPSNTYPPPPAPHEQWQHAQAPPPGQQPPYDNFLRTTPIVPANVEPRAPPPPPQQQQQQQQQQPAQPDSDRGSKDNIIQEIVHHCNALWTFANRYAQGQPQYQPPPEELRKMTQFASMVVRLLEDLKRLTTPEGHAGQNAFAEDARPPKRPWEDLSREDEVVDQSEDNLQSTAEQDMEIIRSKRATSSGANTPGQPKSKYRKRSRATPPGKCHSCNIRETPEWRRGPDGARTLCNACGLHYAKLMRKRDKAADGKPVTIDLQTLRASTASSRGGGEPSGEHHQPQNAPPAQAAPPPPQHHGNAPPVPAQYEPQQQQQVHAQPPPPPPHGSPYQLIPVSAQNQQHQQQQNAPHQMMPPPPPQNHEHPMPNTIPPPPWSTAGRYPAEQSYIRQPLPHSRSPQ